jgi:hypothetical protein
VPFTWFKLALKKTPGHGTPAIIDEVVKDARWAVTRLLQHSAVPHRRT